MVNNQEQHVREHDCILVVFFPDMWVEGVESEHVSNTHSRKVLGRAKTPQLLFSGENNRAQGGTWNWGCYISGVCVWADIDNYEKVCLRSIYGDICPFVLACTCSFSLLQKNTWSLCTRLEEKTYSRVGQKIPGGLWGTDCFCGGKMTVTTISCCCFARCKGVGFARTENVLLTRSCKAIVNVLRT